MPANVCADTHKMKIELPTLRLVSRAFKRWYWWRWLTKQSLVWRQVQNVVNHVQCLPLNCNPILSQSHVIISEVCSNISHCLKTAPFYPSVKFLTCCKHPQRPLVLENVRNSTISIDQDVTLIHLTESYLLFICTQVLGTYHLYYRFFFEIFCAPVSSGRN